jgi:hypothetical protein
MQILSSLPDTNVSITYTQLGAPGGLHFVGSITGLLPIGPNGIPAFNTLDPPSNAYFSDAALALPPTYDYTLDLQGVSNNVTCAHTPESPITFALVNGSNDMYQYQAPCPPGQPDLLANPTYFIPLSNNTLSSWTCQTAENSYTVYLKGSTHYSTSIGNITCNISSIQPTVFPVKYTGQSGIFVAQPPIPYSQSPNPVAQLGLQMVKSVGNVIWEAQSTTSNLVAESIITLGVKAFKEDPYASDERYLKLYESMIEGILDYEVCST